MMPNYELTLYEILNNLKSYILAQPINLGGISGTEGGTGGPPGGFIGLLPQNRIAFDYTEGSGLEIPTNGSATLLHNLNRIRYRLSRVESNQGGVVGYLTDQKIPRYSVDKEALLDSVISQDAEYNVSITDPGTVIVNDFEVHFEDGTNPLTVSGDGTFSIDEYSGANGTLRSLKALAPLTGAMKVAVSTTVTIPNTGTISFYWKIIANTSGSFDFYLDNVKKTSITGSYDYFDFYAWELEAGEHTFKWEFVCDSNSSASDTVWLDEIVVNSLRSVSGGSLSVDGYINAGIGFKVGGIDIVFHTHVYGEDLSSQIPSTGNHFTVSKEYLSSSLRIYYNGIREKKSNFTEDPDHKGFTLQFSVESGDEIMADYDTILSAGGEWGASEYGVGGYGG